MDQQIKNINFILSRLAYFYKCGLLTNREFDRLWDNYWALLPNPFEGGY